MIVLSEFFATGFSTDIPAIGEEVGGESQAFLSQLAMDLGAYVLGGVVIYADDGRGRNQSVVYNPEGREIGRYWKIFPFTFGGEPEFYDAGNETVLFMWDDCHVSPFICYDMRFPEVFRRMAAQGTQLYTVIANWPAPRREHWITLLRARAIENQAYVIGINRCGKDPKLEYAGDSMIIDPRGEVIANAGSAEGVIEADVDLDLLVEYRQSFPALSDMRPEFCNW
jgi:predicted amidohydrolase